MDISKRLALSYYKTIAVLNNEHRISLVQHQSTQKIHVKKILTVYQLSIYEQLYAQPVKGTPRIIEYAEENQTLTLIEEYISGNSLQELLDDHALTVDAILDYMLELCDILNELHSHTPPIIHRDIKPSNIMITNCNHVILLDFNAAKYYSEGSSSDTVLLGTKGYAAPEQYGFGASSPRTDIYGLGVLLQEMCEKITDVPAVITQIIKNCTQLDPAQRFSTVDELKQELLRAKSGEQTQQENPPVLESVSKYRSFLPPGFRTDTLQHKIIATLCYLLLLYISCTLETTDAAGNALAAVPLWFERISCLCMGLSVIAITCDYRHIQQRMHLHRFQNPLLKCGCILVIDVLFVIIAMLLMFFLEAILFPS